MGDREFDSAFAKGQLAAQAELRGRLLELEDERNRFIAIAGVPPTKYLEASNMQAVFAEGRLNGYREAEERFVPEINALRDELETIRGVLTMRHGVDPKSYYGATGPLPPKPKPSAQPCQSCGAAVIWIATKSGKAMPLDDRKRPVTVVTLAGDTVSGYVSHFATCPQSAHWRKSDG